MIRLIREDGVEILLNARMIHSIEGESRPTIMFKDGRSLRVKNSLRDIREKIRANDIGTGETDRKTHNTKR